jgi:hypothetical protein
MPETNLGKATPSKHQPLGEILQQADLVSAAQIQLVLQDQKIYTDLKIGEILALRGWVKQETSDFFASEWQRIIKQSEKKPIGYYLKQAGLLDEEQVTRILEEQKRIWMRFGALAVLQGSVKQGTIDFFLKNLSTIEETNNPWITRRYDEDFVNRPTFILEQQRVKEQNELDELVQSIVEQTEGKHKNKRDKSFFSTLTETFGKITKPDLNK